jgi:hypothetical protein
VINSGAWNAPGALGLKLPPPPDPQNPNRPGDLPRPRSLAAFPGKLVVLDEANLQLMQLAPSGASGFRAIDSSPDYLGALDLSFDAHGALWALGPAGCQCARRLDGAGAMGLDVPLAPELYPGHLYASGSTIAIESFDGPHVVFRDGAALSPNDQRAVLSKGVDHPALGLSLGADLPDPPAATVHVVGLDANGTARLDVQVDVTGAPGAVEALGPGCADSIVLVALVTRSDGALVHVVTRLDRNGRALNQGSAPIPSDLFGLFRGFALGADGSLFQFRPEEDHYDVVRWSTGC